jgi:hypothetical protein
MMRAALPGAGALRLTMPGGFCLFFSLLLIIFLQSSYMASTAGPTRGPMAGVIGGNHEK